MSNIWKYFLAISPFLYLSIPVRSDTFSVKLGTDQYVNVVSNKFLSFTVDPKYLFTSNEKYQSNECICMATSLTPAYLQIAGPSTSRMSFNNTTILMENPNNKQNIEEKPSLLDIFHDRIHSKGHLRSKSRLIKQEQIENEVQSGLSQKQNETESLKITLKQWNSFAQWAKSSGFHIVFAINNNEKNDGGMWDPNTALNILTIAEKTNISDIFWQLGYECTNQTIEEYLNDLETLKVMSETFTPGQEGGWQVVGGDITNCLHEDSKSDFKDYLTLSTDMLDAVLLNGNTTSVELQRMSSADRVALLRQLGASAAPLWLVERPARQPELYRAADWITSLGYSAKNGFAVHFRELLEEELYEPTLSFYMALLFKNLVGERVLDVEMEAKNSILFAHCTSLRHKPVSGAVTLYGVNIDDEPARFSIKLSKREDGGDVMQFILGHDSNGNIAVNGRPMYYEGDIKPVVKRVRPYKTLLLNLPPKSFGFWVLANTKIEACMFNDEHDKPVTDNSNRKEENIEIKVKKSKRSVNFATEEFDYPDFYDAEETFATIDDRESLKSRINNLENGLKNINLFLKEPNDIHRIRSKRQIYKFNDHNSGRQDIFGNIKDFKRKVDGRRNTGHIEQIKEGLSEKLHNLNERLNFRKKSRSDISKIGRDNISKRSSKRALTEGNDKNLTYQENSNRKRRSLIDFPKDFNNYINDEVQVKDTVEISAENEIPDVSQEDMKLGQIVKSIYNKIQSVPFEDYPEVMDTEKSTDDITDEGLMRSTLQKLMYLLTELNRNLNRIWKSFTVLE